jgi:hypothetical protein
LAPSGNEERQNKKHHYSSYIVAVSFIGGVPEENHRPVHPDAALFVL